MIRRSSSWWRAPPDADYRGKGSEGWSRLGEFAFIPTPVRNPPLTRLPNGVIPSLEVYMNDLLKSVKFCTVEEVGPSRRNNRAANVHLQDTLDNPFRANKPSILWVLFRCHPINGDKGEQLRRRADAQRCLIRSESRGKNTECRKTARGTV